MADSKVLAGGSPSSFSSFVFNPIVGDNAVGALPPGTPVAPSFDVPGEVIPANARRTGLAGSAPGVIGVMASVGIIGRPGPIVRCGEIVSLTTEQWDAVISDGSGGGLEQGAQYFAQAGFPATSGKITTTAPASSGAFRSQVGMALSPTDLYVLPAAPIVVP